MVLPEFLLIDCELKKESQFWNNLNQTHNFSSTPTMKSFVPVDTNPESTNMQNRPPPSLINQQVTKDSDQHTKSLPFDWVGCLKAPWGPTKKRSFSICFEIILAANQQLFAVQHQIDWLSQNKMEMKSKFFNLWDCCPFWASTWQHCHCFSSHSNKNNCNGYQLLLLCIFLQIRWWWMTFFLWLNLLLFARNDINNPDDDVNSAVFSICAHVDATPCFSTCPFFFIHNANRHKTLTPWADIFFAHFCYLGLKNDSNCVQWRTTIDISFSSNWTPTCSNCPRELESSSDQHTF